MEGLSRDERQEIAIEAYRQTSIHNGGRLKGTLNHTTGFGKTTEAKKIIDKIKSKQGELDYKIVVPTTLLQNQWESRLDNDNTHEILTIQGIIANIEHYKKNKIKTTFLIIDEIHKFSADKFKLIFEVVEYTHILGLTATWKRLDGKEILLEEYCPIIDIVTREEARRNGWVADYMMYCLGLEFNDKDKEAYRLINQQVEELMAYFNGNYDYVIGCCSKKDRSINGKFYRGAYTYIQTNPDIDLYDTEIVNGVETLFKVTEEREKVEIITKKANICRVAIMNRKDYTNKAQCKVEAALDAINRLQMKTITFGTSTEIADTLTERLGKSARSYHSNIESQVLTLPNKKGVLKLTKVGKDKLLKMYIEDFESNQFNILNTAKKADLGLDVTGLRLGIDLGRTGDDGTLDQILGRVSRDEIIDVNGELISKEAIYLLLYVKGTKEESSLKWLVKKFNRVRWINNLNQIKI